MFLLIVSFILTYTVSPTALDALEQANASVVVLLSEQEMAGAGDV